MKLFCSAPRGNTVHRYDLQLKGPKEETFGPEALCQRGSLQAARVHVNCPVSASAAARSTPSSVTDVPAHASPKDFEGCVLCPLFVAVPVFASSRSGPCKGCKLHSSVSVCGQASVHSLHKTPAEGSCCLEMSALEAPGSKSFSQKTNPKGQSSSASLRCWHRDALWHQSLPACVCHTSDWGHRGIPEMA